MGSCSLEVSNSSPQGPHCCMFSIFPCCNAPDSNEQVRYQVPSELADEPDVKQFRSYLPLLPLPLPITCCHVTAVVHKPHPLSQLTNTSRVWHSWRLKPPLPSAIEHISRAEFPARTCLSPMQPASGTIYPFILCNTYPYKGHGRAGAYLSCLWVGKRSTYSKYNWYQGGSFVFAVDQIWVANRLLDCGRYTRKQYSLEQNCVWAFNCYECFQAEAVGPFFFY